MFISKYTVNPREKQMKDLPGYEELYKVGKDGRVWSCRKKRYLKPREDRLGYIRVSISKKGKTENIRVHKLVAITYLGLKWGEKTLQVDHKNQVKADNRVDNLQLLTRAEHVRKDRERLQYGGLSTRIKSVHTLINDYTGEEIKEEFYKLPFKLQGLIKGRHKYTHDGWRLNTTKERKMIQIENNKTYESKIIPSNKYYLFKKDWRLVNAES